MRGRQKIRTFAVVVLTAAAAGVSGCTYMDSTLKQAAPEATASSSAPETTVALPTTARPAASAASAAPAVSTASAAPITREKASTDCWMKYEKEGRGLSLDQRLPLVEKCTADRLKAQAAR